MPVSLGNTDIAPVNLLKRYRAIFGTSELIGPSDCRTRFVVHSLNCTFESRVVETVEGHTGGGTGAAVFEERLRRRGIWSFPQCRQHEDA
jgi:hypothetical protein